MITRNLILIFLSMIILSACTERIEIELDETYSRLVVEGEFTDEANNHRVVLSKTSDYFANEPAPIVSGAIVSITDGNNTFPLTETAPGIYETAANVKGVPENVYTLNISNVDIDNDGTDETYTASTLMRPVAPVDSIQIEFRKDWGEIWTVKAYALDPPSTDYYMFNVYSNGILLSDTIDEVFIVDDLLFNGNYTNGIVSQFFEEDEADIGDTITFEMSGITKQYFDFLYELQTEAAFSAPMFSGPPANIKGNISNGALGFFAAYGVSRGATVIKEK